MDLAVPPAATTSKQQQANNKLKVRCASSCNTLSSKQVSKLFLPLQHARNSNTLSQHETEVSFVVVVPSSWCAHHGRFCKGACIEGMGV
jgi:hypothetical protein